MKYRVLIVLEKPVELRQNPEDALEFIRFPGLPYVAALEEVTPFVKDKRFIKFELQVVK